MRNILQLNEYCITVIPKLIQIQIFDNIHNIGNDYNIDKQNKELFETIYVSTLLSIYIFVQNKIVYWPL